MRFSVYIGGYMIIKCCTPRGSCSLSTGEQHHTSHFYFLEMM